MKMKICKACGVSKEETGQNFYETAIGAEKFRTTCKDCARKGKKRNYPEDVLQRYLVDENECWVYTGSLDALGYGNFYMQQSSYKAHRISYEVHKGKIPKGLVIDHKCRKRSCINPDHLEAVTQAENVRRTWLPPHCATCSCKGEN